MSSKSGTLKKGASSHGTMDGGDALLREGLKAMKDGMSADEYEKKFGDAMKETVDSNDKKKTIGRMSRPSGRSGDTMGSKSRVTDVDDCKLSSIVLKVTTFTDPNADAPMFVVGTSGARIGKDEVNDISVPSDSKMNGVAHAVIEFSEGSFFLRDGGFDHSAAVKLVPRRKVWVLETDSRFSAGASVFKSCGRNSEGALLLEIVAGPLRGERRFVSKKGLTIGRAIDNSISLPADRELSRKHSEIVFDDATSQFYICDVGSTNGTYMQLVGPYASRKYKLNINDNVLVARTGFSVNRFDIGFSEEIGVRSTMEDNTAIYQYLKIPGLSNPLVSPLSYLAVYDGHGGSAASAYLSKSLHANVVDCLASAARDIQAAAGVAEQTALDEIITRALRDAFITTDAAFLSSSPDSEHGSTATVVLVMGQRLYCANVGDSRTVLSRNFAAVPLSSDHRPSREDEAKRIKDAGGHIISNRVMGVLAVSRSFGDANLKKSVREMMAVDADSHPDLSGLEEGKDLDAPLVIAEPEFSVQDITPDDNFIVLACDGLYDVFTNDEVIQFVKAFMDRSGDSQKCCQALSYEAIKKRGAKDNVSVILVILNKWWL